MPHWDDYEPPHIYAEHGEYDNDRPDGPDPDEYADINWGRPRTPAENAAYLAAVLEDADARTRATTGTRR